MYLAIYAREKLLSVKVANGLNYCILSLIKNFIANISRTTLRDCDVIAMGVYAPLEFISLLDIYVRSLSFMHCKPKTFTKYIFGKTAPPPPLPN